MTLVPDYFRYLDHFRETATVSELFDDQQRRDIIALRHDIDHDLDLALEMAHHEHARGIRATYFLLHTNPYWDDPNFAAKCRQIAAYGHEIGLHINVLTEWVAGDVEDVESRLAELLDHLRASCVRGRVRGVSAHGDPACYQHRFSNYWMWKELRGVRFGSAPPTSDSDSHRDDPAIAERGVSAEGIPVNEPRWQVPYPPDHAIRRADGQSLPLWCVSFSSHDLDYDAAHVPFDHYWTDSGGSWSRSGDPLSADLSRGRHQVLIHPEWWRGPKRLFMVLSTARAGSTWLANFVEKATPARGFHERTLNVVEGDGGIVEDKRTTNDYLSLIESPSLAAKRIRDAVHSYRREAGDVLECNVYLEPFLEELKAIAPDATLILLHRDGRDVVRSILNRGWYDTPDERRHRVPPVPEWDAMTQFERACWYYRHTNEAILPSVTRFIAFERMVSDQHYLTECLADLGIVVHPLLAEQVFAEPMNASRSWSVSPASDWPEDKQAVFENICGPVQRALGYAASEPCGGAPAPARRAVKGAARDILEFDAYKGGPISHSGAHTVAVFQAKRGLVIQTMSSDSRNAHRLLALGRWRQLERAEGIECHHGYYFRGRIDAEIDSEKSARLFALFFDSEGDQLRQHVLAVLKPGRVSETFAFSPAIEATHFCLAIHLGLWPTSAAFTLRRITLEQVALDPSYRADDMAVSKR